jgi:uncharacterized repeat protein (TIGR03843 family)
MGRGVIPTETRDLLTEGDLKVLGLLPRASNYTFLAEVSGGGRRALAVYKPRAGETPLWDFPEGTLCNREVAAALVAEALGWPAVPPTVLRDGPHGEGSVQLYVDFDPGQHYFTLRETRLHEFRPVAAFDVIVGNGDRKAGHCLVDAAGTIWSVDHGLCFHPTPWLRTVIWDFAGEPIHEELLKDAARVAEELRTGRLREELAPLLDREEIEATAARAEALVGSARYPMPGPRRSQPWPAL